MSFWIWFDQILHRRQFFFCHLETGERTCLMTWQTCDLIKGSAEDQKRWIILHTSCLPKGDGRYAALHKERCLAAAKRRQERPFR